ncbi:pyridoxamine 5'-phosphate oxidase family protein [Fodinicola feengrottensis]|uniref:pyridoxamine 5'-phosphate oxidase family protein n=1 Tax=Fodinicola feengrottensis TaxID=435914 RepID=UPI00244244DD|nr:pyridoxamine 5'-phosphate oxidase family protein [Fodinicola feengrottensis]
MVAPASLAGGAARFLAERTFAALTARDSRGTLWTSPVIGPKGFLDGTDTTLRVHALPAGPLQVLPAGQPAGMIAIDFATRCRLRVNGDLTAVGPDGFEIDVEQAYGNCPQYIHHHDLESLAATERELERGDRLSPDDIALIQQSDTFFLGTTHQRARGVDTSHRGGEPGFVRVEESHVWWPDYPGNNLFNSLGNLAVDDTASLLFLDFGTGLTLHLSGTAAIDWATGRTVHFTPSAIARWHPPRP